MMTGQHWWRVTWQYYVEQANKKLLGLREGNLPPLSINFYLALMTQPEPHKLVDKLFVEEMSDDN